MKFYLHVLVLGGILVYYSACQKPSPAFSGTTDAAPPLVITQNGATARKMAADIKAQMALKLATGLTMDVWATDTLAPDPIAMSIDDQDRVYITRTNRQKNSEFDIRGHQDWMTRSIALQTVEERRAFLHDIFAPEKSDDNTWLADLNQDSLHDWRDLAVEKEEVWRLEDTDGDSLADRSTRVVEDFHEEITDVAGALLVRDHDMFIGVGPDMWRLEDTDGDGLMDRRTSLSHGYAVHIGFSGHGMSGVTEGPDGMIYWGLGDIGASLVDKTGQKHHYPNEGIIVRCNPDGSNFEVFAHGLRNTHEFVFDDYGNLITSDNDGDHRGESERLVHIVEGSDAGWRANWQYGKYTDPRNNGYNVWMDEKLYVPRWEGQANYIIPPIQNFHNGPTGMLYNPGTALGSAWLKRFFLVEFVGSPASSHIWSFTLKPQGASFVLDNDQDMVSGFLPTGIRFANDGSLMAADWVNGWGTKNFGRIWRIDVTADKNDLAAQRQETARRIKLDFHRLSEDELYDALLYADQRIRMKAQVELAGRGQAGASVFMKAVSQTHNQLGRIHGIWGLGQLIEKGQANADPVVTLLEDHDPEIIAQAAKVLGDKKVTSSAEALLPLLQHQHPRVLFFAAQALGRLSHDPAFDPLTHLLADNADEDVYLRHAASLALSRIGTGAQLGALNTHSNRSVRLGGVLALRMQKNAEIQKYLKDSDAAIVAEAVRAIHDDESIPEALPALAAMINNPQLGSEPVVRRIISACLRVGHEAALEGLVNYIKRPGVPTPLKAEAIAALGTWAEPSVLDRVDGRYRGEVRRDAAPIKAKITPEINGLLTTEDAQIQASIIKLIAELKLTDFIPILANLYQKTSAAEVKAGLLSALATLNYDQLGQVVSRGLKDGQEQVRATALGLLDKISLDQQTLTSTMEEFMRKGSNLEKQRLMGVLGKLPAEQVQDLYAKFVTNLKNKKLPDEVILELSEAIALNGSQAIKDQLNTATGTENKMDAYRMALTGGNRWSGYTIFNENATAQCIRCHTFGGAGSNVGPDLSKIGGTLTREQILESIVDPSVRIAPGYGTVTLQLKDGQEVTGRLAQETAQQLTLITSAAEPLEVPVGRITKRTNHPSSMPPLGGALSKRQLRDLVEFLAAAK